jgi:dTDP-4-amino-4,6-dideoxygalactose transaminase
VDIDPSSYNIDAGKIEAAVTDKARAIIPVHLYGQMGDMDPIMDVARRHNLFVVEDAAQAIGSEYKGRRAGSIGDFGCFSFFPSKNLGGFGDGGMVTVNDPDLAHKAKLLRNHGAEPKYYHKLVGGNFRLDALQAAILRVKLPYLDGWTAGRQRNAARYRKLFADANLVAEGESAAGKDGVVLPVELPERRHIYNQFVIRTDRRAAVMAKLKERKIGCEIYYPVPLHLQECFAELGYKPGELPHAELAAKETVALPIYPELTEEMQAAVVAAVAAAYD